MKRTGAAMIWACLLLLIGTIIIVTMITLGTSYHQKSIDEMTQNQAYITARSGAETVANAIINKTESGISIAEKVRNDGTCTIEDMNFGQEMGKCSVTIIRDENNPEIKESEKVKEQFTIISTAEKVNSKETVKIVMKENKSTSINDIFLGASGDISATDMNDTVWQWKEDGKSIDDMPNLTSPPEAVKLSGKDIVVGETGKSTHYYFDGESNGVSVTQNNLGIGNGNIYIYIKSGAEVTINSVQGQLGNVIDGIIDEKPVINIFIIVEDGGILDIKLDSKNKSYVYLYTKTGNVKVNVSNGTWYGGLTCFDTELPNIHLVGNVVDVHPGYPQADGDGSLNSGYTYDLIRYEK